MGHRFKSLLLPITRNELPAWGWFLKHLGKIDYKNDRLWADEPPRTIRGKWHGYKMTLDMTNWSARKTYFLGRYYELHTQLLLNKVLKPGDRVLDIGANIGMVTLHAANLVGETGKVEAFEPNPQCQEQIQNAIDINKITQIKLHPFGLSDADAQLELKLNHTHSGIGTFAEMDPDEIVQSTTAHVKNGDAFFDPSSKTPKIIKIDVEGFEYRALKGMESTLRQWLSMVVMEMNDNHLKRAGTSCNELGAFMIRLGYKPFDVRVKRSIMRYRLDLVPVDGLNGLSECRDVLWVAPRDLATL